MMVLVFLSVMSQILADEYCTFTRHLQLMSELRATSVGSFFVSFGFYVTFNNISVMSRRCLDVAASSVLAFRVMPHRKITPQTHDMIFHPKYYTNTRLVSSSSTYLMLKSSKCKKKKKKKKP